jgi:hypothetical protein
LWIAYLVYGLFFDYHIATHDYYHLPFIPIVALSLASLGNWFFARLGESTVNEYQRSAVYIVLLFGMFIATWNVRNQMKSVDYRPQGAMFSEVGDLLRDETVVALTQDYGSRLEYWGWKSSFTWPYVGDLAYANVRGTDFSFERLFERFSSKRDFFLVTDFEEYNRQTDLKERLGSFPIYAEGDGFLVFDLRRP